MPIRINEGFTVKAPFPIDDRLIVDRVSGTTASLEALTPQYNYRNMIVWVREDKAFYYLRDNPNSPSNPGITFSDWVLFSGGGGATTSCTKSGYITGDSFTTNGTIATASVVFQVPYTYASYSVAVTGLTNYDITGTYDDYVYSVVNLSTTGFDIQVNVNTIPLGATAMWIASCFEGSNDIAQGGFGAQGPTGPGGGSAINFEEIAYGTGTGITSSSLFTFDQSNTNLVLGNNNFSIGNPSYYSAQIGGYNNQITSAKSSVILGSTGSGIVSSSKSTFANSTTIIGSYKVCSRGSNYSSLINNFNTEICGSTASVIIGSKNALLKDSLYSSILNTYNSTIRESFYSTSISNYGSLICGSKKSSIISSYLVFMTQSNYSSIISGYNSQICESKHSVILGGGGGNTICSPNLNSSQYGGIVFGGSNLICDSIESAIFNSGKSCIMGSDSNFSNNILGGFCNKIYCSRLSGIIGGFCSSLTSSTTTTCFNSIFYSSHSQIIGNTSSGFNIIMGSTGSFIQSMQCTGKGGANRNTRNSIIIGGECNNILGSCNSLILGGSGITIIGQTTSLPIVGKNNRIDNVVAVPSLVGFGSLSLSVKTASNTTYPSGVCLDDNFFTLIAYPDDPGNLNVCLPYADALGRLYVIKKAGTSTQSTVTVRTRGSDCIDGYSGDIELINPWDYYMLQADGVDNWIKLGGAVGLNL
jgi:hypothetical protein